MRGVSFVCNSEIFVVSDEIFGHQKLFTLPNITFYGTLLYSANLSFQRPSKPISGPVDRASVTETQDVGSILG